MHFFGNFWAILASWILICILHADLDPSILLSDLTPHHCFLDGNINLIMYVCLIKRWKWSTGKNLKQIVLKIYL